jgi:hypothetical protein
VLPKVLKPTFETMKNHYWRDNELLVLEEWDWVSRFINAQAESYVSDEDSIRRTSLEGQLLILNKLVIVYDKDVNQPSEIMSFKEFINVQEKYKSAGQEILFHPINFRSLKEFNYFILQKREELFSLSK